ncbi:MAG: peptidylprolyl isomerase [Burkholderiales bacterium]|nr:peptidylprolyl isomerase [Burkholderiales bacterium]MBP9769306.1 peptidylprolyl isomerase [Burkholderiales bacterium]
MYKILLSLILNGLIFAAIADNPSGLNESAASTPPQVQALENSPTPRLNPNSATTKTVNKIVAYVNKRIITQNEVSKQIVQARNNLQQRGIANADTTDLRAKVLDQLIMQQIQLDLAARGGIKTSDAEVTDAITSIEKGQSLSDSQFRAKLTSQGVTFDDFRQQISDQITIEKLKQREVDGRVVVNDDEVTRILNSASYKNRIDYRLADIVVNIPEQATLEVTSQKQALADQIYTQLKQGASFDQLVLKYSNGPNVLNGGDLGWKSNTSLPPIILNQISNLPVGGIAPVVKFPGGFFIFKVNAIKQHGTPQIVRQYHVRHILIKVNELTSDDEAHQKIQNIYNQLAKDSSNQALESKEFTDLAKQYSDDTSSLKGGDIGWVNKGDTVPQFEQQMMSNPVGKISQPFKSPFGWHILEVLETRDSNLANDREKAEIRQELRETKAQILYTEWMRNLRDMAYVKINDD